MILHLHPLRNPLASVSFRALSSQTLAPSQSPSSSSCYRVHVSPLPAAPMDSYKNSDRSKLESTRYRVNKRLSYCREYKYG